MKNYQFFSQNQMWMILTIIPIINFFGIYAMSLTGNFLNEFFLQFAISLGLIYFILLGLMSVYLPKSKFFKNRFYCHLYIIVFWFVLPVSLNSFIYWLNQ